MSCYFERTDTKKLNLADHFSHPFEHLTFGFILCGAALFLAFLACATPKPKEVWIIEGEGISLVGFPDAYWTNRNKVYSKGFPAGWSPNWRDAKQYSLDTDIDYVIPNGMHCCYSETPLVINSRTGEILRRSRKP